MDHVAEAKNLLRRAQAALKAINTPKHEFTEDEVLLRFTALEGILIMAVNDIGRMARAWEEDE